MSAAQQALRTAIRQLDFAPAYYLYGSDEYLKAEAARDLVNAAADPATRDFNLDVLRASDVDAETLGTCLSTPPMMAACRVVVLREVEALRKDGRTILEQYLARPAADLLLVLIASPGAAADRKLSGLAVPVEFTALSGDRVPKWIVHHVERELKSRITPDAVLLLQNAVGTDLAQLTVELEKLASFAGDATIDSDAVAGVVGVRAGETMGDLLDGVAARDVAQAFALLPGLLRQPKTTAVTLVMALGTQTLALGWARAMRDGGTPARRLEGELFSLLKNSGSTYTGRAWGEAVRSWARHVDRWPAADVDQALDALLEADTALKETRLSSDEQLLATLVLVLCGAPAARRAA